MPINNDAQLAHRAAAIIAEALAQAPSEVVAVNAGRMTFKYEVTVGEKVYIVRFYPRGREHIARFEPALVRRLEQHALSVPRVLCWTETVEPLPFMAYERLPGVSLDTCLDSLSDQQLDQICVAMNDQLTRLTALPIAGYGDLTGSDVACNPDWKSFIASAAGSSEAVANRPYLAAARAVLLASPPPTRASAALAWTDISPENIIVDDDGDFAGLIDFEGAMALQPEANLGYCLARYRGTRFYDACARAARIAPGDRHWPAFYAVIRGLRILPYIDMEMPAGGTRDRLEDFLPGLEPACIEVLEWGRQNLGD